MIHLLGTVDREANVIFIVTALFLILFVVAGVRDIMRRSDDEE